MPTFIQVEVSGTSYLGDPVVQNKVVKQTGYTGLFFKKPTGTWAGYTTAPTGKQAEKNFTALVPSPVTGTTYQPTFGGELICYSGTANPVNLYFDITESKWKCGLAP